MSIIKAEKLIDELIHKKDSSIFKELEKLGSASVVALITALGTIDKYDRDNALLFCSIISTLGIIKDVQAVEPLIDFLEDENVPQDNEQNDPRIYAAWTLGELHDLRAVEPLAFILKNDDYPELRCAVASVLGEIGDERALPALEWAEQNDVNIIKYGGFDACIRDAATQLFKRIKHGQLS